MRRLPESIRQLRLEMPASRPPVRAAILASPPQECAMQSQTMAAEKLSPAAPPADAAIAIDDVT
ncbi:MAG: hypothetical protein EOS66_31150, partial [Mesorhizobium sp.]